MCIYKRSDGGLNIYKEASRNFQTSFCAFKSIYDQNKRI